ncbi:MAG: PKD domain-containing protein, partial [Methanoregulaceae archaeon]|nr:PKD domain-containing protein [Methanoregulaceae archaeon]
IANVYVNGNPQGAVPSFQFTNVVSDQTIRAEFAIKQFTLTATAGPGGAIAPSGVITVNYGGSQTFLISPDPGFGIQNVFVDGVSVGRNSTLMINNIIRNHNINALFVQPPVANFTGSPTIGTVPLTVQFTDASENNPSVWIWDLGDGTFSSDPNPVHTYNLPGVYNVSLKVINAAGNNLLTRIGYITVSRLPFADFTAEPTSGTVPLAVQFTDTSDGNPVLWIWKFGDGAISTDRNPIHIYTMPGTYDVTLTVQNVVGGDSITKVDLITVQERPVADFSANRTGGVAPVAVQFYDHSTGTGPISRFWDFGDNHTSLEENPVHVYENAGVYTVRLMVTNPVGTDTKVRTGFIVLTAPLGASFTAVPAEGDVPLTVVFTDTSTDNPFSWTWNFGDGTYSTVQNPIHTYVRPGTYTVTLSVLSLTGSSSASKEVTVDNPPKASFRANPTMGTDPLTVQFMDTSTGDPTDWEWSFGNGDIALHVRNPIYTYNQPGTYSVVLHVVKGEQDDFAIKTDYITVLPQVFP